MICRFATIGPSTRRGFTLIEVVAAAGIIGVLFLVTIPLLASVQNVRREADRRMIAVQEIANLRESVAALAMSGKLDEANIGALTLSPSADRLPAAKLNIQKSNVWEPVSGHQVTMSLSWTTDESAAARPVVVTAWFPRTGAK